MSGFFIPRMDILPSAQRLVWPELRAAAALGFVLYGGTAIALRLGHRFSVDFDFFSEEPLERENLRSVFPFMERATTLQDRGNTLTLLVPAADDQPVKISFFGGIDFGRVGEPAWTQDGVLQVAALEDLLATKLKVILQRAEAKDYRDLAAMLKAGVSLAHGLAAAHNGQPVGYLLDFVEFVGNKDDRIALFLEVNQLAKELRRFLRGQHRRRLVQNQYLCAANQRL